MDMDVYEMTPNDEKQVANVVCWVTAAKAEVKHVKPIE